MILESCVDLLLSRNHPNGAFRVRDGGDIRPDATAWAVLALRRVAQRLDLVEKARRHLQGEQLSDGRLVAGPQNPSASWPTPLALLAWHGWKEGTEATLRTLQFLENARVFTREPDPEVGKGGIDSSLRGWAWIAGTSCWVEPTALAVFSLSRYGSRSNRIAEGVRLLLDRQLPNGGWNYGNTRVFGTELYPTEETIGPALTALAGQCEKSQVEKSLRLLEEKLQKIRTPQTLSWGILGLAAWGERPLKADAWIEECLDRQQVYGNFDTTHLALLVLAARCTSGLAELFPLDRAL